MICCSVKKTSTDILYLNLTIQGHQCILSQRTHFVLAWIEVNRSNPIDRR